MFLQITQLSTLETYFNQFISMSIAYAPKLLLAIVTLFIGLRIINWLMRSLSKQLQKRQVDNTIAPFLVSVLGTICKVMLLLSVASLIGIETTSFVAILGAAGLAVGLALQGSLANFAGGVLILVFKPFKPGDFIEAMGYGGSVKEIQIFHTAILLPDGRTVVLANGALANGAIVNHNTEGARMVEVVFGVAYDNDLSQVRQKLLQASTSNPLVIQDNPDKAPFVGVLALEAGAVKMCFRTWTQPATYWDVYFKNQELVKSVAETEGIRSPMPTQTVFVKN